MLYTVMPRTYAMDMDKEQNPFLQIAATAQAELNKLPSNPTERENAIEKQYPGWKQSYDLRQATSDEEEMYKGWKMLDFAYKNPTLELTKSIPPFIRISKWSFLKMMDIKLAQLQYPIFQNSCIIGTENDYRTIACKVRHLLFYKKIDLIRQYNAIQGLEGYLEMPAEDRKYIDDLTSSAAIGYLLDYCHYFRFNRPIIANNKEMLSLHQSLSNIPWNNYRTQQICLRYLQLVAPQKQ